MANLKDEKTSPQYQLKKYYPQIHKTLQKKQYDLIRESIRSNIQRGIEQGLYRENLDADLIARVYFAGMTSLKDDRLFPRDSFPMVPLMNEHLEYHLRGIVTPKGRTILNTIINSNQD